MKKTGSHWKRVGIARALTPSYIIGAMPRTSRPKNSNPAFSDDELRDAEEFQPQNLPIWREALLGVDWLSLRVSSVHRGVGVPRGDGSPVVLVPGFMGSDRYLSDMRNWLSRIGSPCRSWT